MLDTKREKALQAVEVLTDLIFDLITGVMVLREYQISSQKKPMPVELVISVKRICLSHLFLNLCKYMEFWKRFKNTVPDETREEMKVQIKALEERKVLEFRNKYIGHIWDDAQNRPLMHSEVLIRVDTICGTDINQFLDWINTPQGNTFPHTIISVIELTQQLLITEFNIAQDEIVNR